MVMSNHSSGQLLAKNQYTFVTGHPDQIDLIRILDETPEDKKVVIVDTMLRHDSHDLNMHFRFIFIRATTFNKHLVNIDSELINKFLDLFELDEDYPKFYWAEVPVAVTEENLQAVGKAIQDIIYSASKYRTVVSLY